MLVDERTTVGLDVHARSVVAEAVDWQSGQVFGRQLAPDHGAVMAWVAGLPGPVAVTYEAGPTGFGWPGRSGGDPVRGAVTAYLRRDHALSRQMSAKPV